MNESALLKYKKKHFSYFRGFVLFFILEHPTVQSNLKKHKPKLLCKYTQVADLEEDEVCRLLQGLLILFSFMQKQRIWDLKLQLEKSSMIKK